VPIRIPRPFAALAIALLTLVGSCGDQRRPTRPDGERSVSLAIAPHYAVAAAVGGPSRPINHISVVATPVGVADVVVGELDTTVDPNADSWPLELSITIPNGSRMNVVLTIQLFNDPGEGVPTVEWSAIAGPIEVVLGRTTQVADVTLGRGPLGNQSITAVQIDGEPPSVLEGETVTLSATATGASSVPVFFWSSLDESIATVDGEGVVFGVSGGQARIVAAAGRFADTTTVAVEQRPVQIVPASGDDQTGSSGNPLSPLVVKVTDTHGVGVPGVEVTWTPSEGTVDPPTSVTDANGEARTTWTPGTSSTTQTVTATAAGLEPTTFTATVTLPTPTIALALQDLAQQPLDRMSVGHEAAIVATLSSPAPTGGVTVTFGSSAPNIVVFEVVTLTIPEGQSVGTMPVYGGSEGSGTITADAAGYVSGSLDVAVELRAIDVPDGFTVPFGQTASFPITLARPAPAGGLPVTVVTRNAATVDVSATTVTIPAGATSGNAVLEGVLPGTATIVASHPWYDADSAVVTTAASLNVTSTSVSLNESFGASMLVRFESNGTPIPAPAPGVTVSLAAVDPTCVTVPATTTIATGLVDVTVPLSYGGSATTPCTTKVHVTATNVQPDSVTVTVQPVPAIAVTGATLGAGLQRAMSASLGASNHGGTTVHLASSDPAQLLIAPNATTPGAATLDITLTPGTTGFSYYAQALEGVTGSAVVTATATGFTSDTAQYTLVSPAFMVQGLQTSINSLDPDDAFYVQLGYLNSTATTLQDFQAIRAGGVPVTANISVSSSLVSVLTTTALTDTAVSVQIQPGQSNSPTSVSIGGVAHRPVGNGTTTVSTDVPGFTAVRSTTNGAAIAVTVTTPTITLGNATVGIGLQRAVSGTLGASNHGGTTVHLVSENPQMLLLSPDQNTAGQAAIDVPIAVNSTGFTFYIQGIASPAGAAAIVTASAPGFANGTGTESVVQPAFMVQGLSQSISTSSPDDAFYVQIGIPNGQNTTLNEFQAVRAGGQALVATVASSNVGVGTLATTAGTSGSVDLQIPPGSSNSPSTVASGGVAFHPVASGTATIRTSVPGLIGTTGTTTGASIDVTVSQPTISMGNVTVGSGLMRSASGNLSASNHGGVTLRLSSSDPATLLLSKDASTAGTASIDIAIANGTTGFSYYVHGVEGRTSGSIGVTANATGFADGSAAMAVVQPAFDVSGIPTSLELYNLDRNFSIRVGVPNGQRTGMQEYQSVSIGAKPIAVAVSNENNQAATLVTSSGTAGTATVYIQPGAFTTPNGPSNGGVALRTITTGTTIVTNTVSGFLAAPGSGSTASNTVTIVTPAITVSSVTVGSGLQRSSGVTLGASQHGGVKFHIESSQPSVALVTLDPKAPGQQFIDVDVANGGQNITFYVQGVEGATGTPSIVAKATGFADGRGTVTVVAPALDLGGLNLTETAGGANDEFTARIGIPNSTYTGMQEFQTVSPAAKPVDVTFTTTDAGIAALTDGTTTGASITIQIQPGQNQTPATVAQGGVALQPLKPGSVNIAVSSRVVPKPMTTATQTVDVK
jgi:hypothetical protein